MDDKTERKTAPMEARKVVAHARGVIETAAELIGSTTPRPANGRADPEEAPTHPIAPVLQTAVV